MNSTHWSKMFISDGLDGTDFIISKDSPVEFDNSKMNLKISEGIQESEYEEVSDFVRKYNKMSSGNTTLLPISELKRYLSVDNLTVLMRSSKGKLIGTIICLLLPIKCKKGSEGSGGSEGSNSTNQPIGPTNQPILIHGCTTFLTVHPSIRGMGLCMALIKSLIGYGYKKKIYSDYHMVSFKIGNNSFEIKSSYRPINLKRSNELGFLYPGYTDITNRMTRLKYRTKLSPEYSYYKINTNNNNLDQSLIYYQSLINPDSSKMFSFYPDSRMWKQWVEAFDTYVICRKKIPIGVVSINTIYCLVGNENRNGNKENKKNEGKVMFPIVCIGDMKVVMPTLCNIAKETDHDIIYFHQHGDVTQDSLDRINCIQTGTNPWFSLYNNRIKITPTNLYVPLM